MGVLTVIGLAATVGFGVASVVFYLKSKRLSTSVFVVQDSWLRPSSRPEVARLMESPEMNWLKRAVVLLYNHGDREIRNSDVPASGFPRMRLGPTSRLIVCNCLATSSEHIEFTADSASTNTIEFRFSYLNPGDGGVVEILYESPRGTDELPAAFSAPLIGVSGPRVRGIHGRQVWWLLGFLLVAAGVPAVSIWILDYKPTDHELNWQMFPILALMFVAALVFSAVEDKTHGRSIPRFARKFFDLWRDT